MRTRTPSPKKLARFLAPALVSTALFGCPSQELAPLSPCTVSGVSLEVPQSGVDKVDILFVIDNSGSMSEEQKKLSAVLANLIKPLTTGNKDGHQSQQGEDTEFTPVQSLHIGVVSSDMGVEGAPAQNSCGEKSFLPTDPNPLAPGAQRINKPLGDDGIMQISTEVAVAGISAPPAGGGNPVVVVPPNANCATVTLPPGQRFISFTAGQDDPLTTSQKFGCIAELGRNGCGLEQHLESMLKALTPPDDADVKFTAQSPVGHGTAIDPKKPSGPNVGFLREDAILAVIIVADEDDCSVPDQFAPAMFDANNNSIQGEINVRCGLPENQQYTYPVVDRFVNGLKRLKQQAYQDRIIVAAAVGLPLSPNTGARVHSGGAAIDMLLGRDDMQYRTRPNAAGTAQEPVPTCISPNGDGSAAPARRQLELVKAFGDNGVATSICEDEYNELITVIVDKIASKLTGACLPRKLNPDANGEVSCDVVEIQAPDANYGCNPAEGRSETLPPRKVNGTLRNVCKMKQVPGGKGGEGWYYDDRSDEVQKQCKTNPQRIAFTGKANPYPGSQAKFECFQPVAAGVNADDKGRDAINLSCKADPLHPELPSGDGACAARTAVNGQPLICVLDSCQLSCERDSQCPEGWVCTQDPGNQGRGYCANPTCPQTQQ